MPHEAGLRLIAFLSVFLVVATWERLAARRPLRVARGPRWAANLALVVLNTAVLRLLFPAAAVGVAVVAEQRGLGLLHVVPLPRAVAVIAAVVLLDLAIYLQHRLFHAVPALWRLHQVHHADVDLDVTSGTRFHPVEMVLSMGIKAALVLALGAPPEAVVVFEVILNAMAMFNHGNIALPPAVDAALRLVVVTPDVHRVHHSVRVDETATNFGFNLSWWDRLFGTYQAQPRDGHLGLVLGVPELVDVAEQPLVWLLALPFRSGTAAALGPRVNR